MPYVAEKEPKRRRRLQRRKSSNHRHHHYRQRIHRNDRGDFFSEGEYVAYANRHDIWSALAVVEHYEEQREELLEAMAITAAEWDEAGAYWDEWENMDTRFGVFGSKQTVDQRPLVGSFAYDLPDRPYHDDDRFDGPGDYEDHRDEPGFYEDIGYDSDWYREDYYDFIDDEWDRETTAIIQINDAWDDHHHPWWIKEDEIDHCWELHDKPEPEFMHTDDADAVMTQWMKIRREAQAWDRNSPFFGLHPKD